MYFKILLFTLFSDQNNVQLNVVLKKLSETMITAHNGIIMMATFI